MSDNRINFIDPTLRDARPVVLPRGSSLVPVPEGSTVEVDRSRWGVEVTLTPRPDEDHPAWPRWPMLDPAAIEEAVALLRRANTTGEPLGYLGPNERALERRLEREIAQFAPAGAPPVHVFAVRNGTAALDVAYKAILYKRFVHEHRPVVRPPEIVASASFEATWTEILKSFALAKFCDIDSNTGCMDAAAAEAAITPRTQIIAPTLLYNRRPNLDALVDVARRRDRDLLLDSAHGHMVLVRGIHVVYLVGTIIVSGQGSKPITAGAEYGFVMTIDPVVASYAAKIRNVGRTPNPVPGWWVPGIGRAMGGNERAGEIDAILMNGALNLWEQWKERRARTRRVLREGLEAHRELPWRLPREQKDVEGLEYKEPVEFRPQESSKPDAWATVGYAGSLEWLARETLCEMATHYPPPDDPGAEYHGTEVPWAPPGLIPRINPGIMAKGRKVVAVAQLFPYEFLARETGGEQAIAAMLKMHDWVDNPEIQAWGREPHLWLSL